MKKIIIQGVKGSFHDIAARNYFQGEELELVEADSFGKLFSIYEADQSIDYAVMAIENTIAGSIMYNYSLVRDSPFHIVGEVLLRIKQNLLVLPGTNMNDITEVHSHPMALLQCTDFLDQYPSIKRIEREDTAACAAEILKDKMMSRAAIASDLAAEVYDLDILEEEIETNKRNFTRFLILSRNKTAPSGSNEGVDKASIVFSLKHKTGSLSTILTELALKSCNLTKIQSVPIVGREWQYYFFIDFILEQHAFGDIIEMLEGKVESLKILGHYEKGIYYDH